MPFNGGLQPWDLLGVSGLECLHKVMVMTEASEQHPCFAQKLSRPHTEIEGWLCNDSMQQLIDNGDGKLLRQLERES